jgi:hypothetical protein
MWLELQKLRHFSTGKLRFVNLASHFLWKSVKGKRALQELLVQYIIYTDKP